MKLSPSLLLSSLLVASSTNTVAGVCEYGYTLIDTDGETEVDRPISILEQNDSTVKFKVSQVWSPFGADSVFVQYKDDGIGEYTCVEFQDVPDDADDMIITAQCLESKPETVVEVFVVDNTVTGSATVPQCCHNGNPPTTNVVKYTYVLDCNSSCRSPRTSGCPEVVLDFNDLPDYAYVFDEYFYDKGVKITAKSAVNNNERYTPMPKEEFPVGSAWEDRYGFDVDNDSWENLHNQGGGAARVFNTQKPDRARGNDKCPAGDANGDKDLGSPNQNCPSSTPGLMSNGPGVGDGGAPNSSFGWPNCPSTIIGNVLVIQESRGTCPDDSQHGGTITFDFHPEIAGSVQLTYVEMLDTDEHNTPTITVWKSNDDHSDSTPSTPIYTTPATGDNGLFINNFGRDRTWSRRFRSLNRVQFEYSGSGSIAEIRYRPSKCPAQSGGGGGGDEGNVIRISARVP